MGKITKLDQRLEIIAKQAASGSGGGGSVDAYTKAEADLKFQTIAGMSSYQTTAGMESYLTKEEAASTYLTSADEVPTVGENDNGKILTATYSNGEGSYSWETVPTPSVDEVPDVESTDDGKVLTATYSGGQGSYAWATPAAGGLSVETDGTNYWITVNGVRLYFASSAPTGTIPAGSYGIGW